MFECMFLVHFFFLSFYFSSWNLWMVCMCGVCVESKYFVIFNFPYHFLCFHESNIRSRTNIYIFLSMGAYEFAAHRMSVWMSGVTSLIPSHFHRLISHWKIIECGLCMNSFFFSDFVQQQQSNLIEVIHISLDMKNYTVVNKWIEASMLMKYMYI